MTEALAARFEAYLEAGATAGMAGRDATPAFEEIVAYPLLAGGKRLRPLLCLATVEALGGDTEVALPVAAALEWVHTFSLVHDDLPALDDDDLRRGRPTTHVVHGEDLAILAGDALLNGAYRLVLDAPGVSDGARVGIARALAAGVDGMIRGQYRDLRMPDEPAVEDLRAMCERKTGRLIEAAIACGLCVVDADASVRAAYLALASEIGVGFQIVDDLLDATSTRELLGKSAGIDVAHDKRTYVTVLGLERARALAHESSERADALLAALPGEPTALSVLARSVYARDR